MWGYGSSWMAQGSSVSIFSLITWILVVALLAALVRLVWKKGSKK